MSRELDLIGSSGELGAYGSPSRQTVCLLNLVSDFEFETVSLPSNGQLVESGLLPGLELLGDSYFSAGDAIAIADLPDSDHQTRSPGDGMTVRKKVSGQKTEAEIEVDGRRCLLRKEGDWWVSRQNFDLPPGPVKVRVTGLSENDVISLQSKLIPWLEDKIDRSLISGYKTFEPLTDPSHHSGTKPGPTGQQSKALTIYLPVSNALRLVEILDRCLVESGLALAEDIYTGCLDDRSRVRSRSKRVSLVRDTWPLTKTRCGESLTGFMLDKELSNRLLTRFANNLRHIEQAAGTQSGSLRIDRCGYLMCLPPVGYKYLDRNDTKGSDILGYVSERAGSTSSLRADIYRLYELAGLDPVYAVFEAPEIRAIAGASESAILRHLRNPSDLFALIDVMPELDANKRERLKAIASQMDRSSLRDTGFIHMEDIDILQAHRDHDPLLVIDRYVESLLRIDPSMSKGAAVRLVRRAVERALERSSMEGRECLVEDIFSREPVRMLTANSALKKHFGRNPGQFASSVRGGICSLIVFVQGGHSWWRDE
ncbi:MAG: hypothetical protein KC777_10430 [Cyanobacteria bacterium HKST-UBA02]|nr:hypothetical protein [Cyanobacteria bacterium HKST-UBA02]